MVNKLNKTASIRGVISTLTNAYTAWKMSKYWVFFCSIFSRIWTEFGIYEVNLRIYSKYGKIRTRKNSVFGHILRSAMMKLYDISEYLHLQKIFNPFVFNAPFLYPLKTSEKRTVFWCFQGVEKGCIANEWFKVVLSPSKKVDFINFNEKHIKLMKMLFVSCKRHGIKVVPRPNTQNPHYSWYSRYILCP